MNWHYVEQGKQAGPVSDEQLDELVRAGAIQPDTLVWREGMTDWVPYSQTKNGATSADAAPATSEAVCVECGKIFPAGETIRYGNACVCANCKPIFIQKLAEGAQINTGEIKYAGFWIRAAAKIVDGLILRVAILPLSFLIGFLARGFISHPATPSALIAVQVIAGGTGFLIAMAYEVLMNGKYGATLGKMACKIKIVTAEGQPISYARAFGRFFAEILSGCPTLLIGYIMVAWDDQKRALHDRICNTRVIYKQ